MLTPDNTFFLLVDVQGKLAHSMHAREQLFGNLKKIVKGMRVLHPCLRVSDGQRSYQSILPHPDCSGCGFITHRRK
jgi:hypothetical protein